MKKLLTVFAASGLIAACGGIGESTSKTVSNCPVEGLNQLKMNSDLNSVKMISDGGSIDDKAFNNMIWDGVKKFTGTGSENYVIPTSTNPKELQTYYKAAFDDTQLLVLGGYQHYNALQGYCSELEQDRGVIYIDGEVKSGNVNSIIFNEAEGAFYAGYLAAKYLSENKATFDTEDSKGLKIGVYGGKNLAPVKRFMGGFQQGIAFWNANLEEEQTGVEFIKLGNTIDSYLSGDFTKGNGKAISENLVNKGADIIMPVAGPQIIDTLSVIAEKEVETLVIGVDTDQSKKFKKYQDKFFTSMMKKMDIAAYNAIRHILQIETNEKYGLGKTTEGTMENGLIALATGGSNKMNTSDYTRAIEDTKISAAAKKANDEFIV